MRKVKVPYGRSFLEFWIHEKNFAGVFNSGIHDYDPGFGESELVENALDNPIASPLPEELAGRSGSAVIIASDHTRPVPSKVIIPPLLERLRRGNPGIDIRILIATGFHRATTRQELIAKFGEKIVDEEQIVIHNSHDAGQMASLGVLPSGGELKINRLAAETDLLLSEGFIEPHFFAGFSGGRKSVLPGIAAAETVLANHCSEFIRSEYARTGNLENNPLHRDMLFAARQAGLKFILNVVINAEKQVINAFAGHFEQAHLAGCEFLSGLCGVRVPESDIVITGNGGYPLDQNIYQAVKGMTAAEAVCRPGGTIIMVAACSDGHGGQSFYDALASAQSPAEVLARAAAVPRHRTKPDQWEYQILARIIAKFKVIMVTADCDPAMIRAMHMRHAPTPEAALQLALAETGPEARIAVIPDGVAVIAKKFTEEK